MTNNAKMAEAISAILVLESFRTDAENLLKGRGFTDAEVEWTARKISNNFKTSKERKSALHWVLTSGSCVFDVDDVRKAVALATRYGIDPMSVKSPDEIVKQTEHDVERDHVMTMDEIRANPLTSDWSSTKSKYGRLESCEIDDSRDGMMLVRKIVDSHWGRSRQPWCLISRGADGNMDSAWSYWRKYCGSKKRMGFKDGKIFAFAASNPFDDHFGDFVSYPNAAFIAVANHSKSRNSSFGDALDRCREEGDMSNFKDWLFNNDEALYDKTVEILDADGWLPEYDGLDVQYKFPNNREWWDIDDEAHAFLEQCVI